MATYAHYCERCGEEDGGDSVRCDGCGVQMCGSCASQSEIETETCSPCRRKITKQELVNDARADAVKVLPSMRRWYEKHVIAAIQEEVR